MWRRKSELLSMSVLRIAIGWLFLHEGISKLLTQGWTAKLYLQKSNGPLHNFYNWIASDEMLLQIANYALVASLIVIGVALILGLWERFFAIAGILLLVCFYLAYPPLGNSFNSKAEGSYLIVDKNLIIAIALLVIQQANSARYFGIDRFRFSTNV